VTDFKAVKDSSTSDERNSPYDPQLFLLLAAGAAIVSLSLAILCIVVTFRRKVRLYA
jgi:hypothetical protein